MPADNLDMLKNIVKISKLLQQQQQWITDLDARLAAIETGSATRYARPAASSVAKRAAHQSHFVTQAELPPRTINGVYR